MPRQSVNPRYRVEEVQNLTLGLYTDGSPYNAPPGHATQADNVVYQTDGSLGVRSGYGSFLVAPTTIDRIKSAVFAGAPVLVHTAGNTVYVENIQVGTGLALTDIVAGAGRIMGITLADVLDITTTTTYNYTTQTVPTPGAVQADGGTLPDGTYDYVITWVDSSGSESPQSPATRVTTTATTDQVTLSGAAVPLNITQVRVYRKLAADTTYLRIGQAVPVAGSWSFVDDGKIATTQIPPIGRERMTGGDMATFSAGRLWVLSDNTLTYSDAGNPFYRSGFNTELIALPGGDTPTAIAPYNQGVIIFGKRSATFLSGPPTAGGAFLPLNINDGALNNDCWAQVEGQLVFVGSTNVWMLQGQNVVRLTPTTSALIRTVTPGSASMAYNPELRAILISTGQGIISVQLLEQRPAVAQWTVDVTHLEYHEGILYGASGTNIYRFDVDTDLGQAIFMTWKSTPLSFGDPTLHKMFRRAETLFTYAGDVSANLFLQDAFGYSGATINGEGFTATDIGSAWDDALWDIDVWGAGLQTGRTKLVAPAGLAGNYLTIGVNISTRNVGFTRIIAPLSVEFRVRDRYARS